MIRPASNHHIVHLLSAGNSWAKHCIWTTGGLLIFQTPHGSPFDTCMVLYSLSIVRLSQRWPLWRLSMPLSSSIVLHFVKRFPAQSNYFHGQQNPVPVSGCISEIVSFTNLTGFVSFYKVSWFGRNLPFWRVPPNAYICHAVIFCNGRTWQKLQLKGFFCFLTVFLLTFFGHIYFLIMHLSLLPAFQVY